MGERPECGPASAKLIYSSSVHLVNDVLSSNNTAQSGYPIYFISSSVSSYRHSQPSMNSIASVDPQVPDSACYPEASPAFPNSISTPPIGVHTSRVQPEGPPQGNLPTQTAGYRFCRFHGSCRQCHHFHYGQAIQLPSDENVHRRYTCERCGKPLFGIGRLSPQSSLASLETTLSEDPPDYGSTSRNERAPACTDANLEAHGEAGGHIQSSEEPRQPLDMIPAENVFVPPGPHPLSLESQMHDDDTLAIDLSPPDPPAQPNHHPTSTTRKILDHLTRSLRLRKTKKRQRSSVLRRRANRSVRDAGTITDPLAQFPPPKSHVEREPRTISRHSSIHSRCINEPQIMTSAAFERRPVPDGTTEGAADEVVAKMERIRVQRREATLKSRTRGQPKCSCSEECHCMGSGGSTAPASLGSRVLSVIPQHPFPPLFGSSGVVPSVDDTQIRHHSPSRHVALAGYHLEDGESSNRVSAAALIGEDLRFSRQSTSTQARQ